ncbi:MAG: nucleotide-binding protein [Deltaproteobacteria bacterium]|jgi:hypothetical protein|nr:nucleotide-binding protein [Deltaproteobacteria bacterium]
MALGTRTWKEERERCLALLDRALFGARELTASDSHAMGNLVGSVSDMAADVLGKGSPWLKKLHGVKWSHGVLSLFSGVARSEDKFAAGREEFLSLAQSLRDEFESFGERPKEIEAPVKSLRVVLVQGHDRELNRLVRRLLARLGLIPVSVRQRPAGKTLAESLRPLSKSISRAILLPPDGGPGDESSERSFRNLFFEMGYLAGRLGSEGLLIIRDPDRGPELDLDQSRDFGDISVIVRQKGDEGAFLASVARWLKDCGYFIENKTIDEIEAAGLGKFVRGSKAKED